MCSFLGGFQLKLCVRQNFPNFLFSRVSEKFGCRSSEIVQKKKEFLNSQNFCEKVWKFKFGKKFGNYSKMYVNFKKSMWSLSFWVKKPCFWVKKFRKSSVIVIFQNLRKNDVKLELRKSRKTRSDSKVRNAGP